ncbi:LA_2272 family surface repeat-containing protein [Bdellovibrio sp. HCB337]|uniref:LA_2272 family surface repeat-containing protein n=1 Tax=Bdellovibrio sp. HCB337 TaxID=3394358 RepID=UPI0039A46F87
MRKYVSLFIFVAGLFHFNAAQAALSPVSVAIVPPIQFPPSDFSVTGVRASVLWGKHRDVYGLDVGVLGNITDQTFTGIGVSGIFNNTRGETNILGLQLAGLANINNNKTSVYGFQITAGVNYQSAASTVSGLQLALLANIAPFTDIYGFQIGLYNRAKEVYGFQIGLVNVADNLHGIQIGLINFHHKGTFAISPIINVGF